jgi:uncharacterized membrane protein YkgB
MLRRLYEIFDRVDPAVVRWMARWGILLLRVSVGVVFLWFGALKFVPGASPAEGLASRTVLDISGGAVGPEVSVPVLATWECLIGLGLIAGRLLRLTLLLLFLQMPGTLVPLVLYPEETFTRFPFALTMEGQYIVKNLVLISAGIVVGASVRGGVIVTEPPRGPRSTA